MTSYFIHDGLNHSGPFLLHELKDKTIVADTPVWTEGLGDWSTAREIPELVSLFNLRPTPPPFQGARKSSVAVVPAFNTVSVEPLSHTEYKPLKQPAPAEEAAAQVAIVSEYDQDLYQMEMENYFMQGGNRGRSHLWMVAAVLVLGSLTYWLISVM